MTSQFKRSVCRFVILAGFIVGMSATAVAQTSPVLSPGSEANLEGTQSAMERTIDFVDEQIPPPSTGEQESTGFKLFSDPQAKRSAIKTGATLTLVISLFLLVVFLWRLKPGSTRATRSRNDVLTVLGKVPFVHGQQLQLIRLGMRLLLVASSQRGSQTLAEITDPEEVLRIESAFRQGQVDWLAETLRDRAARETPARSSVSLGSQRSGRTLLEA